MSTSIKISKNPTEWFFFVLTLFVIAVGVWLLIQNRKKEGFWLGVASMALIGFRLSVGGPVVSVQAGATPSPRFDLSSN
jgi:hypothetical protein